MNRIVPALFLTAAALTVSESTLFLGAGFVFETGERIARTAWTLSYLTPWSSTWGEECLLLSRLCSGLSRRCFQQFFMKREKGASLKSWKVYQEALGEAPAIEEAEQELLAFLGKRWLAKANGFSSLEADWICPSYGISLQVHPETTSCYARDPGSKASATYLKRVEEWKRELPYPNDFPLILTRPSDVSAYLPLSVKGSGETEIEKRLSLLKENEKLVIDLTEELSGCGEEWEKWRARLSRFAGKAVCIQRLARPEMGGIRILPLSENEGESGFLVERISHLGLSASPVELDRFPAVVSPAAPFSLPAMRLKREECLDFLREGKKMD